MPQAHQLGAFPLPNFLLESAKWVLRFEHETYTTGTQADHLTLQASNASRSISSVHIKIDGNLSLPKKRRSSRQPQNDAYEIHGEHLVLKNSRAKLVAMFLSEIVE